MILVKTYSCTLVTQRVHFRT